MPRFEIAYSADPMSKALLLENVVVRDRKEAAAKALKGFPRAKQMHGAMCYRVTDAQGMVVARGGGDHPPPIA